MILSFSTDFYTMENKFTKIHAFTVSRVRMSVSKIPNPQIPTDLDR